MPTGTRPATQSIKACKIASRYPSPALSQPPRSREHMNQSNQTNDAKSENPNQERQPIPMAMRFRKAFLMAAVMLAIGWAIGAV